MSNIDLLPRADLPVIWDAFKAQAEPVRQIAETLTVTDISQKEEMALARKTRLTLREIRIAVEHKRVELGEGHLKEIQKVNGAAKAIREFIEPLEARLLDQETFAERAEEKRISELANARYLEASAIRPQSRYFIGRNLGIMPQADFDALIASVKQEQAEIETANRARIEAEKQLAEVRAEAQKRAIELQLELKAESDRLKAEAAKLLLEQQAELYRQQKEAAAILNGELERQRKEAEDLALERTAQHKAEREDYERRAEAARIVAQQERDAEEASRRQQQARLDAEKAIRDADLAEQKRIRDEQFAKLEAELAQERAAKQAEEKRVMELAIAPDVEKLWQFASLLRGIQVPGMVTPHGIVFAEGIYEDLKSIADDIEKTCKSWGLTGK